MKYAWRAGLMTFVVGALVTMSAADAGVTLIGTGVIPGSALDLSGLAGTEICQRDDTSVCIDRATLGGLGSAVTYTGFNNEFLVVERDNRTNLTTPPQAPGLKRIDRIDLAKPGLTDVSDIDSLPQGALDPSIVPVTKTLFIDLLDADYKVSPTQTIKDVIAEKVEGLAWGPDLKNGRYLLYVFSDNDLNTSLPTQIYAFAIDGAAANIKRRRQLILVPTFFPSEFPKAPK